MSLVFFGGGAAFLGDRSQPAPAGGGGGVDDIDRGAFLASRVLLPRGWIFRAAARLLCPRAGGCGLFSVFLRAYYIAPICGGLFLKRIWLQMTTNYLSAWQ